MKKSVSLGLRTNQLGARSHRLSSWHNCGIQASLDIKAVPKGELHAQCIRSEVVANECSHESTNTLLSAKMLCLHIEVSYVTTKIHFEIVIIFLQQKQFIKFVSRSKPLGLFKAQPPRIARVGGSWRNVTTPHPPPQINLSKERDYVLLLQIYLPMFDIISEVTSDL